MRHSSPHDGNADVQILALTASIERIESRWPNGRRTELSNALRRQRGAWKLYRDGIRSELPPPIRRPLIISCDPCPIIESLPFEELEQEIYDALHPRPQEQAAPPADEPADQEPALTG